MKFKFKNHDLVIRLASWQDYQFCYRLTKRNMEQYAKRHQGSWSPSAYRKEFDPEKTKIILNNGRRVGYYMITNETKSLYIDKLQISAPLRGKGLGTKLMELMEVRAKKMRKKSIQLHVFKDNPAKNLYLRLAYVVVDEPKDYLLLLEKKLS